MWGQPPSAVQLSEAQRLFASGKLSDVPARAKRLLLKRQSSPACTEVTMAVWNVSAHLGYKRKLQSPRTPSRGSGNGNQSN
jgi:hypothetical protein